MRKKVIALINGRWSYNDVERMYRVGSVSQREFDAWRAVWEWCSVRLGGPAGTKQEAFWRRFGDQAYYARINKVRRAFGFDPIKF